MLSDKKTKQVIEKNNLLETEELNKFEQQSGEKNQSLDEFLIEKKLITEEILYNSVANLHNLPFVNLKDKTIPKEVLFLIPEPISNSYQIIAFEKKPEYVSVAMTDPEDLQTIEFIKRKVNLPIKVHVATPQDILEAAKAYHKSLEQELGVINKKTGAHISAELPGKGKPGQASKELQESSLEDLAQDMPVIRVVDTLLEYAIFEGASDIHVEPAEKSVIVRFRIDGILREIMNLPKKLQDGILARVKILSNLKLDEHRLPQDGRFKIETKDYKISFRVSIIPVFDGEKVVMRLLDEGKKILNLEELGLNKQAFAIVKKSLTKPHGMVLVTGPTGSGKTTTLYTMMNILNTPKVNIATVEDPVEYRMPHINQSQVNPKIKFTFATGLRALLRQDPNIIMVGEIRDQETASIAINAAMTGHLVLSTLHTNDASGTLPRLLDMNVEPFLVSSTVNVIIAQRLIRKLCKHCRTSYKLKKEEVAQLEKNHGINIQELTSSLSKVEETKEVNKDLSSVLFFKGKGCTKCGAQGYKGRIGIYEVLEMSEEIKHLVASHATADDILVKAREQGMMTLLEDGFLKAKSGITTIEEILRVTKE
ncbi:GspE/PulE family protein [Patescibacteria group bacterium]|nr:GspE/PulE family protein [Patescibacteria group bacterium]